MSKLTKKKTETLYAKMVREEKAMQIAAQYGLQYEVLQSIVYLRSVKYLLFSKQMCSIL